MVTKARNNPRVGILSVPKTPVFLLCLAISRQADTSTPEKELVLAVIKQAVADLFARPPKQPRSEGASKDTYRHRMDAYKQERQAQESARRFFFSEEFMSYAELLNLDPDYVRRLIRDAEKFTKAA